MKIKDFARLLLISTCLFSCTDNNYYPFEDISAKHVKEICDSYCQRKEYPKSYYGHVKIAYNLGIYDDSLYVTILKVDKEDAIFHLTVIDEYVDNIYICSLPNGAYGLDVYVDNDKSYDIQTAYNEEILKDEHIESIINKAQELGLRDEHN